MQRSTIDIQPVNIREASEDEIILASAHYNRLRKERLPDDPPVTVEENRLRWRNIPPFVEVPLWVAWTENHTKIIGNASLEILHLEDNKHLAQFDIGIEAEYRQQGLAREMLSLIVEVAQHEQRSLLMTQTTDRVSAGEIFMTRLGAARGLEAYTNQLRLAELDQELLQVWQKRALVLENEFELGLWDGAYPEDQLEAIAKLMDLANEQPHDDLQIEDFHHTPEVLRQIEQHLAARKTERWTYYLVEKSSGCFVGFTEMLRNAHRPTIINQGMTAVYPEFRSRGLGRWLKAAMLERLLREHPEAEFVRTGNANSNAPMLKINNELGFKPYMSMTLWQIETARMAAYLQKSE
jgi:mycothiol synthase